MQKLILTAMLVGLLTGVSVAQRGHSARSMSPTARQDTNLGQGRTVGAPAASAPSRTMTLNRNVTPAESPIRDPLVGKNTASPSSTAVNQNVDPTAAPIRDPLIGASNTTGNSTTVNRNLQTPAATPVRDPK